VQKLTRADLHRPRYRINTYRKQAMAENKLMAQFGKDSSSGLPGTLLLDHVSAATRLLEKRRQMFEVQEALSAQKEEFNRREDAFRRREDALKRKDLELQESLIKFNKFLQENETKKNRALKRAAEEKKQREQKEIEIRRFKTQLEQKIREEAVLKEELERNMKYQDFLDGLVQSMSKFFPEGIADVLNRYKTLRDANTYLLEKQQADEATNENLLREFTTFKKTKENEMLNSNNEIADMQKKLEQRVGKTNSLQEEIEMSIKEASEKVLSLGQIVSAISNILDRCNENFRRRHNKPMMDKTERNDGMPLMEQCLRTMSKLDEISMFMTDFRDIKDEFCREFGINPHRFGKMSSAQLAAVAASAGKDGEKEPTVDVVARDGHQQGTVKTTVTDAAGAGPGTDKSAASGFGR